MTIPFSTDTQHTALSPALCLQGDPRMPEDQWAYNDRLASLCGPDVSPCEPWRKNLINTVFPNILTRTSLFRDDWTAEEQEAYAEAERECDQVLAERTKAQPTTAVAA